MGLIVYTLDIPRSPWDMEADWLYPNGRMICQYPAGDIEGWGVDVQIGPFGFQRVKVLHDSRLGHDCRACRYIVKQMLWAFMNERTVTLDFMGYFTIKGYPDGSSEVIKVEAR